MFGLLTAGVVVNKGSIRPEDYYEYYKYLGSPYARNFDDEFQKGPMNAVINELGGSTAGTAQATLEGELFGGRAG